MSFMSSGFQHGGLCLLAGWIAISSGWSAVAAHDGHGHQAPTYEVTAAAAVPEDASRLLLKIVNAEDDAQTAARFTLSIDGETYVPATLGEHGLRFVSIHQGKRQRFTATYARGTGVVEVPLPRGARRGTVRVAKGFEYLPAEVSFDVADRGTDVFVELHRWSNIRDLGWVSADEHLHYERLDPAHDIDWLTMLAADDLTHAHFMVLKGGNLPGVWAQQFAYGKAGEASDGERLIRPGEEYRDGSQGHINLLGVEEIIEPISTGGISGREMPYTFPPLFDVLQRTRELGGIGGPAHGAALSRSPTAIVDTVLGAVDFFEIANTHLYNIDVWYPLMNCGYIVPPAAGTDLPNFPFRDPWQPFLGEVRMYVQLGRERNFEAWKNALASGKVFISSGPLIQLHVNDAGPGETIHLPAGGGEVNIVAELSSPRPLQSFQIVRNGEPLELSVEKTANGDVQRWRIQQRVRVDSSCWLAARGEGNRKEALQRDVGVTQNTIAHTAAIKVLVGDQPIRSPADANRLVRHLMDQQEYYRSEARYESTEQRQRFLELFERAIQELQQRAE